jgi:hypothetical protein
MIDILQDGLVGIGLILEAILIFLFLFRKYVHTYPLLFSFSLAQLFANGAETLLLHTAGRASTVYRLFYWADEIGLDLLLFLTVIALTLKALEGKPQRAAASRLFWIIAALVVLLPFLIFYKRGLFTNRWFTGYGQVLSFGGGIMNLALWTALIGKKPKDSQLLALSAGVGLMTTGQALFYGLFQFSGGPWKVLVDSLLAITQVLGVGICCWALWPKATAVAGQARALPTSGD